MSESPVFAAVVLTVILLGVGALAWNVPINHSSVSHHPAQDVGMFATKAYDEGADFYLFNRCKMFVVVDDKKYYVPGSEQNDECTLANPADAFKLMAYTRAGG